jgi:hypothetical protein
MALYWADIERAYVPEPQAHWQVCGAMGLRCPFDVFEQLFHEHYGDPQLQSLLRGVNWRAVCWEEASLPGEAFMQLAIPRAFQLAVEEARAQTAISGFWDFRTDVMRSWREEGTWVRPPILVEGALLHCPAALEALVGWTRIGDLLGMMERGEVYEEYVHRVWMGVRADA